MLLPDVNVLIFAHREDSGPEHRDSSTVTSPLKSLAQALRLWDNQVGD